MATCNLREGSLRLSCIWPVLVLATPLIAQTGDYAGPSILSRGGGGGVAPASSITFRPYINLSALYNNGLGLGNGSLSGGNLGGAEAAVGVYGYHGWKRTVLGLNYHGDYRRYSSKTSYDGTSQMIMLGLTHELSRKLVISFREGAGTYTQNTGILGTFGFYDPTFAQIPHNELLDNRTDYMSTMGDVTYRKSSRLSFNFGVTQFLVRRQLSSLYGVTGVSTRADAAYRLSRGSTIGVDYLFTHYSFSKAFGSADMHSVGVDYSVRLSRGWELGLRAGVLRVETLAAGIVAVDPVIAAIIGQSSVYRAFYSIKSAPTYSVQLQRGFRHASLTASYQHGVTPGNGVYLTSQQDTASGEYSYTGMRNWSLSVRTYYSEMASIGQQISNYSTIGAGGGATRSINSRNMFLTFRFDERRYLAGASFHRNAYNASVGFAYSPGDVPLRLW
jgi:hypothetical protein